MNFGNYTQKSLEAVQAAQEIARRNHHQQLEQIHLLLALLQQEGGLTPQPSPAAGRRIGSISRRMPTRRCRTRKKKQRPWPTTMCPWSICSWD